MTFKKYNHTNNAFCELLTDLQSSDTTMMLQGNFNRFPTSNFIVKISKYQGTKCVDRENIYVANRNNNICTGLVRAYEKVPMNDDATENIKQALNFASGDIVEVVMSSEFLRDIQEQLEKSLSKNAGLRTGFGSNKTVIIDNNGNERIVNSTSNSTPDNTDTIKLYDQSHNEKIVNFGVFKSSLGGGIIQKTAGENLTGSGAIPVMVADNVSNMLHQVISIPASNGRTENRTGTTLDGNITVMNDGWRGHNSYYIVDTQIIIDLGKTRHIDTIALELDSGQSYTRGMISYSQNNSSYTNMPMGDVDSMQPYTRTYRPNLSFRYLKIQKTNSNSILLKKLRFFERKNTLNGVYLADTKQGLNGRIDGFIFGTKNSGQTASVSTIHQFKNIGGFNSVNNSEIYLGGRGILTTTPNSHPIGVVNHNALTVDTTLRSGEGADILNFAYSPNSYQNTNKFYSLVEAVPSGTYKILRDSRGASYVQANHGKMFIEHSFDGRIWKKIYEKNFHNNSFNAEDGKLHIISGYVRAGIEYLYSTSITTSSGNYHFCLNNISIKQIVG